MAMPSVTGLFFALGVLSVVFLIVESMSLALPKQPRWRPDSKTDLAYWFFTPLVSGTVAKLAIVVAVLVIAATARVPLDREHLQAFVHRPTWLSRQPLAFQALATLVVGDFIGYWSHRLFHRRTLWRFHAVHHGSRQLDWLSSSRLHPVNEIGNKLAQVVPMFLIGFRADVLAAYLPLILLYAILQHSNVTWSFGPLRYVLASPAFHRWHHTSQQEGRDKNFAGLFPLFDLVFGTFYLPQDRLPTRFGVDGDQVPDGLLAQMLYPFRRTPPHVAAPPSTPLPGR